MLHMYVVLTIILFQFERLKKSVKHKIQFKTGVYKLAKSTKKLKSIEY